MARENHHSSKITYENPDYPVNITYIDLDGINNSDTGWDWHEDIKIIIVNHGTAQINSDDETIRLLPGQATLIGHNVMHSIIQFGDAPCSYYSITFHPDFVLGSENQSIAKQYSAAIDNYGMRFMIFDESISWHSELLEALNSAIVSNVVRNDGYELKTRGYLCLFWSILVEHAHDYTDSEINTLSVSLDEQRVKEAMSYIRDHHAEKLTLDDIATYIHISKSECCRCFKRSIAMTPFEYLMKYRVYEASNRLKDPAHCNESIADIAVSVGFNNFSYFSKQFGKYMKCTPRQYRSGANSYNPNTDLMSLR